MPLQKNKTRLALSGCSASSGSSHFSLPSFTSIPTSNCTPDFRQHTTWARQLLDEPEKIPAYVIAHAGFQVLVAGFRALTHLPIKTGTFWVTLASYLGLAGVLYAMLKPTVKGRGLSPWWAVALSLVLMVIGPISLLFFHDQEWYFGYMASNSYHNPTILLLKPFAVLQFIFAYQSISGKNSSWKEVAAAAAVSLVGVFIKPNYAICILPALGCVVLYHWLKKQSLDWKMILLGIAIPSVLMLGWQFLLSYSSGEEGGIVFNAFGVMGAYSRHLLIKFGLSIAFPAALFLFYPRETLRSQPMLLAWIGFIFGGIYTYFMAESGVRFSHGNFAWSGEIAMLILFIASTRFFIGDILPMRKSENYIPASRLARIKNALISLAWGLHALFGIFYYISCLLIDLYQ